MSRVTLGELIHTVREKTGESYRTMANRATSHGYAITMAHIQKLATKPISAVPGRDTLLALAVALGVPVEEVALAAVEGLLADMGVELSPNVMIDSRARAWVTLTEGLSDDTVSRLLHVARPIAEALETAGHGQASSNGAPRGGEDQPGGPGAASE